MPHPSFRALCEKRVGISTWSNSSAPRKSPHVGDLLPVFRTSPSMISDEGKGKKYVEEQAHGSADDRGTEASRGGTESGRCSARGGGVQAYALRLEGEVRRDGREPGAGSQAVAG